jgi:SAM-dependent methyltransferase
MRFLLSNPLIYRFQQSLVWSGKRDFHALLEHVVGLISREMGRKARILDIGCGDGKLSQRLGPISDYVGVDLSEAYIAHARETYGKYGAFYVADLGDPAFHDRFKDANPDLILLIGVIHHCSDEAVRAMFDDLIDRFPQARFLSIDGIYVENQNPIAKWLLDNDRGEHIRNLEGYRKLLPKHDYIVDNYLRLPFNMVVFYKGMDLKGISQEFFQRSAG